MDLLNDVVIQCEECGNRIVIQKEYLEPECSSYERGMGAEIAYDIYEECDCEVCGNHIITEFRAMNIRMGASTMKIMKYMGDDSLKDLAWELSIG